MKFNAVLTKEQAKEMFAYLEDIFTEVKVLDIEAARRLEKDKKKKYELKRKINKLFISINSKNKYKIGNLIIECPYVKGKYIIDTKYNKEIGLLLESDENYSIDSREL